jgi:hypothetical protein
MMRRGRHKGLDGSRWDDFMDPMTSKPDESAAAPSTAAAQADPVMPPGKPLSPAAQRALAEAKARREAAEQAKAEASKDVSGHEVSGRGGLDPVRYGDWEVKGLTSDF